MIDEESFQELRARVTSIEAKLVEVQGCITYSQKATADILGVSQGTIIRYRELGMITPISGTTKYTLNEINRFKQNH